MPKPRFRNLRPRRRVARKERLRVRGRAYPGGMLPPDILIRQMSVAGVFEGGGALGTAYIGALRALHDNGVWFGRVAGTSAGAITASMIAAGFTAPEIQWLSSAFPDTPPAPESLSDRGINAPIRFSDFLDLPTLGSVSQSSKRKTLLWKALDGTILDELGNIPVPVPTQAAAVTACVNGIMAVPVLGDAIRGVPGTVPEALLVAALNTALAPLPDRPLHVADLLPVVADLLPDTRAMRRALADTLWDTVAGNIPLMLMLTNLVHEGGLFEGGVFLQTIQELFGRKVHGDPDAKVVFDDLRIPLAVVATDIDTGVMQVYNSKQHGDMEVAEAVRRSMSIPFVFQPRGGRRQFVDGGLLSNFPLWLFAAGGEQYWPASTANDTSVKIGFSLGDFKDAEPEWEVGPARFQVSGTPPRVDQSEVIKPILEEKLVELGYQRGLAAAALDEAFGSLGAAAGQADIEILRQVFGVVGKGMMVTEESTRKVVTDGLMQGRSYVDVSIPLLGYDTFDFHVNEDEDALMAMWDRGWHAAIDALLDAKERRILPPLMTMGLSSTDTPFM